MSKKLKKSLQYQLFYGLIFISLSLLDAQFKTYWPGKVVHISSATGKFLKKMEPKFQIVSHEKNKKLNSESASLSLYRQEILEMFTCFAKSEPICGDDIEHLGQLIFKARAPLIMFIKSQESHDPVKKQPFLLGELGADLDQALQEVYIGTAKSDLEQIRNFLKNPKYDQVIYIYGLIQEIIRHFDGVAITEYDFIVLCHCALFVLLVVD